MRYILLLVFLLCTFGVYAQDTSKKEKVPVFSYNLEEPMEVYNRPDENSTTYIYVPEFYKSFPYQVNDTTYKYELYDVRDSIISVLHVHDINDVRFVSLFKSYPDKGHTYTDANGQKLPLPVSSIVRRYDKVGDDKWMSIDYATNKYTELKEHRTNIVRTDTVTVVDPVTHQELYTIYCYYKVETIK